MWLILLNTFMLDVLEILCIMKNMGDLPKLYINWEWTNIKIKGMGKGPLEEKVGLVKVKEKVSVIYMI